MSASTATKAKPVEDKVEPESEETPAKPDLPVILPEPGKLTIEGYEVEVRRLRSVEFMGLVRVIMTGMGASMAQVKIDMSSPEAAQEDLLGMVALAIPYAIEDFGEFLRLIVDPKKEGERAAVAHVMENPKTEDLLDILGTLIEQEKDDLVNLAGKAQAWFARLQKVMAKPSMP